MVGTMNNRLKISAKGESIRKNHAQPPVPETRSLMKKILSNKPLACDDIQSLDDARKELQRIRKLTDDFKQNHTQSTAVATEKGKRVAIQGKENINDYVKKVIPKDADIRRLLYHAIKSNVLFESNTEDELKEIIDVFEPCTYDAGAVVIQQDALGDEFFVVEKGELSITVRMIQEEDDIGAISSIKVGNYSDGSAFGELALIYGSPRAATITATDKCQLWRIKRGWYRGVVGQHRRRLHKEKVEFLPNVNLEKKKFGDIFTVDQIDSMAQLLQQEYFRKGDIILREGEAGNTFYIIQSGEVNIFKYQLGDKPIATLGKEKFFGEKALLSDDVRQATVVAASSTVVCYVMTRGDFTRVLGNLQDIMDGKVATRRNTSTLSGQKPRMKYDLSQLKFLNVLGQGAFGKVNLVKAKETEEYYALKAQGKQFILQSGQQDYVLNEMRLMQELQHPNILFMHCAMQDSRYIYFLLEMLPGGELMDILERKGTFPEQWVRFYSASVLLAYTELHKHRVVYRDLKPENLVLDRNGYCIMVDMGLAKKLKVLLKRSFQMYM